MTAAGIGALAARGATKSWLLLIQGNMRAALARRKRVRDMKAVNNIWVQAIGTKPRICFWRFMTKTFRFSPALVSQNAGLRSGQQNVRALQQGRHLRGQAPGGAGRLARLRVRPGR